MKAVTYERYGPPEVLKISEVEKPVIGEKDILVKVTAVPVTVGDVRLRKADPFMARIFSGLLKPKKKILGMNFAGEVEETGKLVKSFKKGEKVFGSTEFNLGTYAEYLTIREDGVVAHLPAGISYEEASAVPFGMLTSLHFLRKGHISKGKKVLIYGASGSLGTAGVQLADYFGAEITGVCGTSNIELVKSLGADRVIDYTRERVIDYNETYDIIYDAVGKSPFSDCINVLNKDGYYLRSVHMGVVPVIRGWWTKITSSKKIVGGISIERQEDLKFLARIMAEGKFRPVIDKTFPMEQMAEAHRYVDRGHKTGNVVVNVNSNDQIIN
jgi:NADPH:quinone reductase-like Zn-dependent oxidoreductase